MNHLSTKPHLFILLLCLGNLLLNAQSSTSFSMDQYYEEALRLHDKANYADAASYYDLSLFMNPNCEKCLFNRGLVRFELEKYNKALADFNNLLALNPTDIEAYEQRGHLRYLTGNVDGAISDFSTVISSNPSAVTYTNRGLVYLDLKRYPDAIRDLKNGIRLNPIDGEAQRTLGDALFAINKPEEAIQQYNIAIQVNPRDILAYNNRGNAYQLMGQDEEALADYNYGIRLLENSYTYTNRAKYWIKKENYKQALIDGRAATKLNFSNPEAYYCVGLVENALGNYAIAAENFNKAIALDHKRADYYNGRGLALFHLEEYADAQDDFKSALTLNPADAAAKDRITDCHQKMEGNVAVVAAMSGEDVDEFVEKGGGLVSYSVFGEIPKSKPLVERDIDIILEDEDEYEEEEENIPASYNLPISNNRVRNNTPPKKTLAKANTAPTGEIFYERGVDLSKLKLANSTTSATDQAIQHLEIANKHFSAKWFDQAIQQYTAALNADPALEEAYYKRARSYMFTNAYDQAISDLDEYLLIVPNNADAFNDRGTLRFRTGNIFGALEDYNAGLRLKSNHSMLLSNRGRYHMVMGLFNEAIDDFTQAINQKNTSADIYYQRGLAHFELQNHAAVIEDMKQAISRSNIDRYEFYFLIAKSQLLSLRQEESLTHFNKTIELSPRFAEAYMYRAVAHQQLGNRTAACEDYEMAASLGLKALNEIGIRSYCEELE
ncbi:MAG: tetratricopeptide repeat protein [Saprospiraceae bacterium]